MRRLLLALLLLATIAVIGILTWLVQTMLGPWYAVAFVVLASIPGIMGVMIAYVMLEPDDV